MRVLMVLAMILITAPAVFAQGTVACPPGTTVATSGSDMVDMCMMQCFQIDRQQLTQLRNQGWTDADIAMASAISRRANVPISQVAADYRANPNWSAVAGKYNLTMSDLMVMPSMATTQEEETFNRMFVSRYYNVSASDIQMLRQQGYSWATINMMANAASQTRQPIMTIANHRAQGMAWCDIATRYNVACANLTGPTTTAVVVTPRPAIVGAGPMMPRYIYDSNGGILMTEAEAQRFYRQGFDWTEVAVAANISRETGLPVEQILPRFRSGTTPRDMIVETGVDPCLALNFTNYPFERRSIYSMSEQERMLREYESFQRDCPVATVPAGSTVPGTMAPPVTY